MKKFLLLFRGNYPDAPPSEEDATRMQREWGAWYESLKKANSLVDAGNPMSPAGKVISSDGVQDGVEKSNNRWIGYYMFIQAEDMDGAVQIAKEAPPMADSTIEVREIINFM